MALMFSESFSLSLWCPGSYMEKLNPFTAVAAIDR